MGYYVLPKLSQWNKTTHIITIDTTKTFIK